MKKLIFGLIFALISITSNAQTNGYFSQVKFDTQDLIYKEDCGDWIHYINPQSNNGGLFALYKWDVKKMNVFTDEPAEWIWLNYFPYPYTVEKVNQHQFTIKSKYLAEYFEKTDSVHVVFKFTNNKNIY